MLTFAVLLLFQNESAHIQRPTLTTRQTNPWFDRISVCIQPPNNSLRDGHPKRRLRPITVSRKWSFTIFSYRYTHERAEILEFKLFAYRPSFAHQSPFYNACAPKKRSKQQLILFLNQAVSELQVKGHKEVAIIKDPQVRTAPYLLPEFIVNKQKRIIEYRHVI